MTARTMFSGLLPSLSASNQLLLGVAISVTLPICSFMLASTLERTFSVYMPNMIFLCGVILAAIWFGRAAGLLTAGFAFLLYNYYLIEPRNTFTPAGLNDLLTISIFVAVALLIGGLAGAVHDERNRAREQVRMLTELFSASRSMAGSVETHSTLRLLTEASHRLHDSAVAVFDAEASTAVLIHPPHADLPTHVADRAKALLSARSFEDRSTMEATDHWRMQALVVDGAARAVLAWREHRGARAEQQSIFSGLLVDLAQAAITRAEAARRQLAVTAMAATDRLRTALLSSISHDFRTPLATIIASASSLQAYGHTFSESTRADLLTSIQEEAERLSRFVGNVLDMTRLEAGVVKPHSEWTDPLELIEDARDRIAKRSDAREMSIKAPAALPTIEVDPVLLEQAVINVLDNALVHTPPDSKIEMGASYADDTVRLWVEDDGPGVAPEKLPHIFDRFREPASDGKAGGLGLGLAISKGFVEAMNGAATATSPAKEGRGLRIEFAFPSRPMRERA